MATCCLSEVSVTLLLLLIPAEVYSLYLVGTVLCSFSEPSALYRPTVYADRLLALTLQCRTSLNHAFCMSGHGLMRELVI